MIFVQVSSYIAQVQSSLPEININVHPADADQNAFDLTNSCMGI